MSVKPLNNSLPSMAPGQVSLWESISYHVHTLALKLIYSLYVLASCLDYFSRRQIFSGGQVLGTSYNFGKKEFIPHYIRPWQDPELIAQMKAQGFTPKSEAFLMNPYGNGICMGSTIEFAKLYFNKNLDTASKAQEGGGSLDCVRWQAEYNNLSYFYNTVSEKLAVYLRDQTTPLDLSGYGLATNLQNQIVQLTQNYIANGKLGSYLDYFKQNNFFDVTHAKHAILYATIEKAEKLYGGATNDLWATQREHLFIYDRVGFEGSVIMTGVSPQTALTHNWEEGVYSLSVPITTCLGWVTVLSILIMAAGLEITMLGNGVELFGVNLQYIGAGVMVLSAIGAYIGSKRLGYEGQHALIFIKEKDRCILHDPNNGTGTHADGQKLLRNLFDYYTGDLDNFRSVMVEKLRNRAAPAV